ncbi:MAG: trigger factor [Planctomycetota bacterium]
MATEVSEIGPCKRKITVTVPADQVKAALDSTWQKARQNISLKGFRQGKVPKHILEKRYGNAVREEVKQNLVNDAFREALQEYSLSPVRQPQVDIDALEIAPGKELEFEITVEVHPEFEAPDLTKVEVSAPPVEALDSHVDQEIERLRSRKATMVSVDEGVSAKGDYLIVDVSYQVDGAIVLHHEDTVADTNRETVDDLPISGGISAFSGKEKGSTITVPTRLPDDFEPSGFAGAEAQLLCTVKGVRRVTLPELNEEFAREMGAESVEDMKEKVRAEVQRHMDSQRNRYIEERAFDALIKATEFDLPADLLDETTARAMAELEQGLIRQGQPEGEAKANVASSSDRIRQDQARSLRISFLMDRISQQEKLFVTENEIESSVRALAAMQNMDSQALYDDMYDKGQLSSLRAQILESKVRKLIREKATVVDAKVDPADS